MRLTALADLPNGVKAGQRFKVPDYQGELLLRAKVAEPDDSADPAEDEADAPTRRTRYRRRDLTAEG